MFINDDTVPERSYPAEDDSMPHALTNRRRCGATIEKSPGGVNRDGGTGTRVQRIDEYSE